MPTPGQDLPVFTPLLSYVIFLALKDGEKGIKYGWGRVNGLQLLFSYQNLFHGLTSNNHIRTCMLY